MFNFISGSLKGIIERVLFSIIGVEQSAKINYKKTK